MFQKKIVEKYLSNISSALLTEKYAQFCTIFANEQKQENIRNSKEEQYQEGFIRDLFCSVLGYTIKPEANYNILTELKNESKSGDSKKSDAAIILNNEVKAVIELKGTDTQDLDKVAFQAFSYKNHHEKCNYVIVSNFERLRLYVETQIEYEEFNLFKLNKEKFDLLYLLLALPQIQAEIPLKLKHETLTEEKEITNNFYADYSTFKRALFEDLCENNPSTDKLLLFKKTQKLLDRILFVLFCEDRNLLPNNSTMGIINDWKTLKKLGYPHPLYNFFKTFFERINTGFINEDDHSRDIFAYNGGLFKSDEILDNVKIGDDVLYIHSQRLANYDFQSQISVDILGRIFENSLTEIEEIEAEINKEKGKSLSPAAHDVAPAPLSPSGSAPKTPSNIGKRKKDGVFYTPEYITKYIVENTIGKLCDAKKKELNIDDNEFSSDKKHQKKTIAELDKRLETYREWLLSLKILDPACGSGAFLNAALKQLRKEHTLIDFYWSQIRKNELNFSEIDNAILENNIYGVDINEESVEIAKLSLWLSTAKKNRKLSTLANNIKCGNSLIDDPNVAGEKAFDWKKEFPEVFEKGGFDVVIGNPPYVQLQTMDEMSDVYAKCGYESYNKSADLYCLFTERGYKLLKKGGILSFIMPNKWMLVDYGKELRRFLAKTNLLQILNFGDIQFFKDATTYVCIFVTQNAEKSETAYALSLNQKTYHGNFLAEIPAALGEYSSNTFDENSWIIRPALHTSALAKMEKHTKLKDLPIEINYGIKTGYNDAFFIDGETRAKLIAKDKKSIELIQPLFRGRDISVWITKNQNIFLINPHNGNREQNIPPVNIDEYPVLKEYLNQFIEKLTKRADKGDTPYNMRNCVYLDEFAKPKIVYPNMTSVFPFCYDESGAVCNDKAFIITEKTPLGVSNPCGNFLKYLLPVFNSKLSKLWIWYNCPELQGGTREIRKAYFENFPVPNISSDEQQPFITLADKMLSLNSDLQKKTSNFLKVAKETFNIEKLSTKLETFYDLTFEEFIKELKQKITPKIKLEWLELFEEQKSALQKIKEEISATDREINSLVYKLYGLTNEEIAVVEKK